MKILRLFLCCLITVVISSCGSDYQLNTPYVLYQSVRIANPPHPDYAKNAEIIITYDFNSSAYINVEVLNNTDRLMAIDLSKSYIINAQGRSYFFSGANTESFGGGTFNAQSGGDFNNSPISTNTSGNYSSQNSVYTSQEIIRIAPKSSKCISKSVDSGAYSILSQIDDLNVNSYLDSPVKFCMVLSYSTTGDGVFKQNKTDFYINARIKQKIRDGKNLNSAIRYIYTKKPDAVYEPCWYMFLPSSINEYTDSSHNYYKSGKLYDFQ